jgi:hypothetical protein
MSDADALRRAAIAARMVADEIVTKSHKESAEGAMRAFALVLERMAEVAEIELPSITH